MVNLGVYFASNDTLIATPQDPPTDVGALMFTLRLDLNENDQLRIYAKCDEGYQIPDFFVQGSGASVSKFEIAADSAGTPSSYVPASGGLNIGTVNHINKYFWIRGSSIDTESVSKDLSITFEASGVAEAV